MRRNKRAGPPVVEQASQAPVVEQASQAPVEEQAPQALGTPEYSEEDQVLQVLSEDEEDQQPEEPFDPVTIASARVDACLLEYAQRPSSISVAALDQAQDVLARVQRSTTPLPPSAYPTPRHEEVKLLTIPLPKFKDLSKQPGVFLKVCEETFVLNKLPPTLWSTYLSSTLTGDDRVWFTKHVHGRGIMTWSEVSQVFLAKFDEPGRPFRALRELAAIKQRPNESIDSYIGRFEDLLFDSVLDDASPAAIVYLEFGILPPLQSTFASHVAMHAPKDAASACELLRRIATSSFESTIHQVSKNTKSCKICKKSSHSTHECWHRTNKRHSEQSAAQRLNLG